MANPFFCQTVTRDLRTNRDIAILFEEATSPNIPTKQAAGTELERDSLLTAYGRRSSKDTSDSCDSEAFAFYSIG